MDSIWFGAQCFINTISSFGFFQTYMTLPVSVNPDKLIRVNTVFIHMMKLGQKVNCFSGPTSSVSNAYHLIFFRLHATFYMPGCVFKYR